MTNASRWNTPSPPPVPPRSLFASKSGLGIPVPLAHPVPLSVLAYAPHPQPRRDRIHCPGFVCPTPPPHARGNVPEPIGPTRRRRSATVSAQPLEPRHLLAVQPLGDLNTAPSTTPAGGGPIVAVGDIAFFTADDSVHGNELWRTNPAGGASLVKDINPGTLASRPRDLTAIGDKLYFTAAAPRTGEEPWVSDGTEAGTVPLADVVAGAQSSRAYGFRRFRDHVYFIADRTIESGGYELWRTDGTPAGTT